MRDGLAMATGAPFDGTSDAIPAAAETGFEARAPRDSSVPAPLVVLVFTNVFVPSHMPSGGFVGGSTSRVRNDTSPRFVDLTTLPPRHARRS